MKIVNTVVKEQEGRIRMLMTLVTQMHDRMAQLDPEFATMVGKGVSSARAPTSAVPSTIVSMAAEPVHAGRMPVLAIRSRSPNLEDTVADELMSIRTETADRDAPTAAQVTQLVDEDVS